ncbi:NAD(P)-dependent oxidoreductase, partial [Oleiphilus sp. HI0061]
MQGKKVLIVGCGKIGGRVAKRLSSDFQVFGLRRRPQMSQDDIHYLAADVREASSLEEVFSQVL